MHRAIVAALSVTLGLAGCLKRTSYTSCKSDSDCAAAGATAHCESNGACSIDDPQCPSGRRYVGSAPSPDQCVGGDNGDAPQADGPPGPDAMPPAPGRECIPGIPLATTYSACAAMVDAKEPRCGTETWDKVCVRWAEQLCQLPCSGMAMVGADGNVRVIRLSDDKILWTDPLGSGDAVVAGAWADYDNDGDPDLATSGDNLLRIWRNDGYDAASGTLMLHQAVSINWGTINPSYPEFSGTDAQWVDYDHDGDMDVVFGGYGGLVILRNDGDDVFVAQDPLMMTVSGGADADPIAANIIRTAWGDYDGDGWPDLATVRFGHPPQIWHNDHGGTMTLTTWTPNATDFNPNFGGGVAWCNVDSDPEPELVSVGYTYVFIADNRGGVLDTQTVELDTNNDSSDVECADMDGDGDLDLVVSGDDMAPSRAYCNDVQKANGFSTCWTDTNVATDMVQYWNAAIGDLDGDHKLDVIFSGNEEMVPLQFQRFRNTSTVKNKIDLAVGTHDMLPIADEWQTTMALAPLVGH